MVSFSYSPLEDFILGLRFLLTGHFFFLTDLHFHKLILFLKRRQLLRFHRLLVDLAMGLNLRELEAIMSSQSQDELFEGNLPG
mmetsp:Transcript_3428/g.3383  ORF Transcript_3428/g.3383 Transcript_3428/m.3383 type:complete len:83 (-) Transcript_3428:206-454(-)